MRASLHPDAGESENGLPLDGIHVLDLSRFIAGPYCGMLLGDMGAEVIKIEKPERGDEARGQGPVIDGESSYVLAHNRNKLGLTLNFRDARAQKILRRLAANSDVLIENFRPGTLEQMGCGVDVLHRDNPGLVVARVSGFGQAGPAAGRVCFDAIAQAASGLMSMTGEGTSAPVLVGTYIVDYCAALYAANGILLALRHRDATGKGQVVDISLQEVALSVVRTPLTEYLRTEREPERIGNRDRFVAPARTFETADNRWVHLVAGNDAHFPRLAAVMGREDLLTDERFGTRDARLAAREEIEAIVAEWVNARPAREVVNLLEAASVPCAEVATVGAVAADPQVQHRRHIVSVPHTTLGTYRTAGCAINLSDSPAAVRSGSPTLGEHTDRILGERLGYDSSSIAELRASGVV